MYENVLVGVVSVDETVAISDVEPLDNAAHGVGDDGLFSRLWSIASGLLVVILSGFSVNGGSWLLLDGLFCNFSGHIGVVVGFFDVLIICVVYFRRSGICRKKSILDLTKS